MKFKLLLFIFFVVFFLVFIRYSYSVSYSDFITPTNCSAFWNNSCNSTILNDASMGCNGTQHGNHAGYEHVVEVYINASAVYSNYPVNATCEYHEVDNTGGNPTYEWIWYYNGTDWATLYYNDSCDTGLGYCNLTQDRNKSVVFNVNSTEGIQVIRCAIGYFFNTGSNSHCLSGGTTSSTFDNDDINFTVVTSLNYTYWNITFTNGTVVSDGATLTRTDSVWATAKWSKNLSSSLVQHNGNGTLLNYTINSSFPENWTNYTLNFSNATEFKTGLINISYIWANDSFNLDNSTSPSHYFYLWGFSKVNQISSNQSTIYNNTAINALCKITDNITNQGINNFNVSFYGNNSFLNWSLTNSSGYANLSFVVNATSLPANYTIKCNTTNEPSLYYNASYENSSSTNVSVLSSSNIQVGNVWFNYSGITTNKTNLFTNLTIYANVTDDWRVSTVLANLSYPNNATVNLSMLGDNTSSGWHVWNYTFNNSLYPLNASGNYTVKIIANNSNGISNSSNFLTFYVNNTYDVNLSTNYSVYNRGENITVQIWDVNNFSVYNLNWTTNLTKFNQSSIVNNTNNTNYTYTIANSDPEGNYSLSVNVSKNNNTANNSWNFSVSKNLTITISSSPSSSPSKNSNVIVSVSLYNARGELYNSSVNANITCVNTMYPLNFSSGQASYTCVSPNSYNTLFNITVNATDSYNNTGENYTNLTTEAETISYLPGGGGGGGGFTTTTKKCSDKTLYDQCSSTKPLYCSNGTLINKCSVCGCNNTDYGCQPDGSCILVKKEDFTFDTNITSIDIMQGEDKEFAIGTLKNTGNTVLNLKTFLNAPTECCNITLPSTIELREREENEFSISVHAQLTANVSDYLITIGVGTSTFKKERSFSIVVSRSPIYASLAEIGTEIADMEKEIQNYKNNGIDVENLESIVEQAKQNFYNANNSINNDQLDALTAYITQLANDMGSVQSGLSLIRSRIFYSQISWIILLLALSSFVTVYTVPEVLMPLHKIRKEIKQLKEEEKILVSSRVETEKQYFLRKIDENTFSKIMIGKQDKILKTRATLKEKEDETKKIIETRLKPRGIATTIKEEIKKVFKKKN